MLDNIEKITFTNSITSTSTILHTVVGRMMLPPKEKCPKNL